MPPRITVSRAGDVIIDPVSKSEMRSRRKSRREVESNSESDSDSASSSDDSDKETKNTKDSRKPKSSSSVRKTKSKQKNKNDTSAKDAGKDSSSDDKSDEGEKRPAKGMKAEVKMLWAKTDAQCKCCTTWVEENPDDGKDVEETDACLQHAIVVRKKKKHEGNRKPLKVDSIVVHSPLLKKLLQKLFIGYPDLVTDMTQLVFDAPFAPFFHRWEAFEQMCTEEKDEVKKSHLKLLYDALDAELKPVVQKHKDLVRHNAIDFEILWTLFTPGELLYSHDDGHDRLYKTLDHEYWQDMSGPKFTVRCDMIDWDGEKFGKVMMSETMSKFKGTKKIKLLSSYPLKYHPKGEEIKRKCVERGQRFKELAGCECKDYKGTAIEYNRFTMQTVQSKRHIEGRVMLDEELFSKFNPDEIHSMRELDDDVVEVPKDDEDENGEKKVEADKGQDKKMKDKESTREKTLDDNKAKDESEKPEKKDISDAITSPDNKKEAGQDVEDDADEKPEEVELTEEQFAICNTWLRGYSLTYQKWAAFSVEYLSDVRWNENAFEELTLPADYRELILATIKSQIKQNRWKQALEKADKLQKPVSEIVGKMNDKNSDGEPEMPEFDDFIAQKGLGYIMLFSGNPGVGKTATAESIAELLHVPLCIVSVGNLGTSAESVESGLQDILELSSKWNAVLLLDEADVFLEQRTSHEIHRNAVVSVFLRLMEYYKGVLCLTTNRSEEIDVAFHSRIHISLPFPDLTENNREQIWRRFAKLTEDRAEAATARRAETEAKTEAKTKEKDKPIEELNSDASSTSPLKSPVMTPSTTGPNTPAAGSTTSEVTAKPGESNPCTNNGGLVDISNADFKKLAQTPLNGRQIKNAFKTAVLLASYKKEKVGMKHVKTALKTIDGGGLGKREVGRMYY